MQNSLCKHSYVSEYLHSKYSKYTHKMQALRSRDLWEIIIIYNYFKLHSLLRFTFWITCLPYKRWESLVIFEKKNYFTSYPWSCKLISESLRYSFLSQTILLTPEAQPVWVENVNSNSNTVRHNYKLSYRLGKWRGNIYVLPKLCINLYIRKLHGWRWPNHTDGHFANSPVVLL